MSVHLFSYNYFLLLWRKLKELVFIFFPFHNLHTDTTILAFLFHLFFKPDPKLSTRRDLIWSNSPNYHNGAYLNVCAEQRNWLLNNHWTKMCGGLNGCSEMQRSCSLADILFECTFLLALYLNYHMGWRYFWGWWTVWVIRLRISAEVLRKSSW